jgi:pimeloyl-ACP methyl ester carboxylesterase
VTPPLFCVDSGPRDGRPVVMLHGNLSSSRWWERLAPLLGSDLRLILPDLRGYGRSPAAPPGYDAQQMAADVRRVMEERGIERAVLVGHSMGGAVAMLLAAGMGERAEALALIDPVPACGLALPPETLAMMEAMRTDRASLAAALGAIAHSAPRDAYFDALVEEAAHSDPQAWREIPVSFTDFDIVARLPRILCPVLCIMGGEDTIIPARDVDAMCRQFSHCEQVTLPGVGHCPQIEAPSACAEALRRLLAHTAR